MNQTPKTRKHFARSIRGIGSLSVLAALFSVGRASGVGSIDEPAPAPDESALVARVSGQTESDELVPDHAGHQAIAEPFLAQHCLRCHAGPRPKGDLRLEGIGHDMGDGETSELWRRIFVQVQFEQMPPPADRRQPDAASRTAFLGWVDGELERFDRGFHLEEKMLLPDYGNYVNHEQLFSGEIQDLPATPARLWRLRPDIYAQIWEAPAGRAHRLSVKIGGSGGQDELHTVQRGPHQGKGITTRYFADPKYANPFYEFVHHASGFSDYATIAADQASLESLLINAEVMAEILTEGTPVSVTTEVKSRDSRHGNNHGMFVGGLETKTVERRGQIPVAFRAVLDRQGPVPRQEFQAALDVAFNLLLRRAPTAEEVERCWTAVFEVNAELGNKSALQAVLIYLSLSPEFVYRMEIGLGEEDEHGRRLLSPHELVYAIHHAFRNTAPIGVREFEAVDVPQDDHEELVRQELVDRHRVSHPRDGWLAGEMRAGRLQTRADVERAVRHLLDEPPRVLHPNHNRPIESTRNPRILQFFREYFGYHRASSVFKDTEEFKKREGFAQFHDHTAVRLMYDTDALILHVLQKDQDVLCELLTTTEVSVSYWDGKNPADRVAKAGGEQRYVASHDAQSYNLDPLQTPYQRESFLELPEEQRCGILTQPSWLVAHSGNFDNDPVRRGKWIREKLLAGVVMDVPITVDAKIPEDEEATLRERFRVTQAPDCIRCHQDMNPLGMPFEAYNHVGRFRTMEKGRPVDTTGAISDSGEAGLDGAVAGPREMMQRLARSERVRQCFVRHVFRFWMGRNETLSDSRTLIAMDQAYVDSGGSFKELLVSLLTSDSFLLRK